MRIHRYSSAVTGNSPRVAVATGDGALVDLARAWRALHTTSSDESVLTSTIQLIERDQRFGPWPEPPPSRPVEARVDIEAEGFRWLCPLDRLASLRDFLAFEDHVRRAADRRGPRCPPTGTRPPCTTREITGR